MVGAVDLATEVPSESAANNYIGREVLMGGDASDGNCSGQTVGRHLAEPSRVLVRQDASNGPSNCRVVRGERTTAGEKMPVAIVLVRPLSLGNAADQERYPKAVDRSLAGKQPGLGHVVIMPDLAQQKRGSTKGNQRIGAVI